MSDRTSRRGVLGLMSAAVLSPVLGCEGEPALEGGADEGPEAEAAGGGMLGFTAVYVYADGVPVTFGFPGSGVSLFQLNRTAGGPQTFYTSLHSTHKGTVTLTLDAGVYGFSVPAGTAVSVSPHPDVVTTTRTKGGKDPWPTPPPPPPPTKLGVLSAATWNLHFSSPSLRANELMFTLGATNQQTAPTSSVALPVMAVHIAATRRSPENPLGGGDSELTFPLDTMATCHQISHRAGAGNADLLVGEHATREAVREALQRAAETLHEGGMFVLSFAGHGGQRADLDGDERDGQDELWQLYDGPLGDDELWQLLAAFDRRVHCVVIADCCNAGPASDGRIDDARGAASTVLIAAARESGFKVNTPTSSFARALDAALQEGPKSYRELAEKLATATAGSEPASVWCSSDATWERAPLIAENRAP